MNFPKFEKPTSDFKPVPAGNHVARCYLMVDIGYQKSNWKGKEKTLRKVVLGFELPDELTDDGKPYTISKRYTYSMGSNAALRGDLESWRGKAFDDATVCDFELPSVLGASCLLNVVHAEKEGGGVYSNIDTITRLPKGLEAPPAVNELILYSPDFPDAAMYERVPEWLRKLIEARVFPNEQYRGKPLEAATTGGPTDFDDDLPW